MSKFTVEVTVPEGLKAGDTFEVEVETPKPERKQRGQLAGIALEDMTDEQLKREIINANSVLYKAKQRGASEETIAVNQARVDAAKAEKAKRTPAVAPADAPAVEAALDGSATEAMPADEGVYDESAAAEM